MDVKDAWVDVKDAWVDHHGCKLCCLFLFVLFLVGGRGGGTSLLEYMRKALIYFSDDEDYDIKSRRSFGLCKVRSSDVR